MTQPDSHGTAASAAQPGHEPGQVDRDERERLAYALGLRFAPHLQAAAAAVRDAEDDLSDARNELSRA